MDTLLDSTDSIDGPRDGTLSSNILEGDWVAYRQHLLEAANQSPRVLNAYGGLLPYKRAGALAYLGRRAQLHGGVCSRIQPRILTSIFVAELGVANETQRFMRYPWLKTLLSLLAEMEKIQDDMAAGANVISLVPPSKVSAVNEAR
ncbi:hypothetical protein [Noviherbaspirillum pedocola]|uniref:Uncharacterized protein n=1 Tax=Noviherbaspirillum pedocola TaxID=2801341 RepID=A0A934SXB8_9BURK|nr:hypothetical protein [Noviherbaspirillum pedocola]MBK4736776.1 hypothetical protein [Noviherbaspirillum pedocola]